MIASAPPGGLGDDRPFGGSILSGSDEPKPDMTEAQCPGPVRLRAALFSFTAFIAITLLAAPLVLMAPDDAHHTLRDIR